MTDRDPALEPFDALIGTWVTEATHPLFDGAVPGSVTFEWLEGGRFVVQRSHNDHELFPDAICVIGAPEGAKGWSWSTSTRAACGGPTASRSRTACCGCGATTPGSPAVLGDAGARRVRGPWQLARTPGDWQDDLRVVTAGALGRHSRRQPEEPRSARQDGEHAAVLGPA